MPNADVAVLIPTLLSPGTAQERSTVLGD
jgi:hypothetical protein